MFTFKKQLALAGVALALGAVAGCSSTPTYPPAPNAPARLSGTT